MGIAYLSAIDVERDVAVRDVNDFVDYLAQLGAVTV
jgi:hypothetical protein